MNRFLIHLASQVKPTLLTVGCASLLMLALPAVARADGAGVDVATPEQKASAQQHFETAIKAFGKDRYDAALTEFSASYGVVASPNAHYMMAKCLAHLGKSADAYNALGTLETDSKGLDKYAETLKNGSDLRAELAKKVGLVVVSVTGASPGQATAAIGGANVPVDQAYAVAPGHVEVSVLVSGHVVKTDSATVAAGETHAVKVSAAASAPPPGGNTGPLAPKQPGPDAGSSPVEGSSSGRTGFFVGAGVVGAVAVAGFAVGIPFGVMFNNDKAFFTGSSCPNHQCNTSSTDLANRKSATTRDGAVATAGFVVGGVAAGGSIILAIVGATRPKHSDQASVDVNVGVGSLGLSGSF